MSLTRHPVSSPICREMETEEQKKDRERLNRYIARENLVSIMNNTKWSELRDLMLSLENLSPKYRTMCLRIQSEDGYYWDSDWYYHLPTYKWIEWLDIDPIHRKHQGQLINEKETDLTKRIKEMLWSKSIPFSIEESYIRIWGYQRPGNQIKFAYQDVAHNSGGCAPSA